MTLEEVYLPSSFFFFLIQKKEEINPRTRTPKSINYVSALIYNKIMCDN